MSEKDKFFALEGLVFALFPMICWIGSFFGNLRLARWGAVWMAVGTFYWLKWLIFTLKDKPQSIGSVFLLGVFVVPFALRVCHINGLRTYWLERKKNDRVISFWPSLLLASAVFALFVAIDCFVR